MYVEAPPGLDQSRRMIASSDRSMLFVLEGIAMAGVGIFIWWLSSKIVSPLWSIVSMANYIWLCFYMFRIAPQATLLFLPVLVNRASTFVSLIMIEYGAKIPELGTIGSAGPYSTSFFVVMQITFAAYLLVFHLVAKMFRGAGPHPLQSLFFRFNGLLTAGVLIAASLSFLWLVGMGLLQGFPLIIGADRFAFRAATDIVTLYSLNYKAIVLLALGMVTFVLPSSRAVKTYTVTLALSLSVVYFLYGDKFFTQLSAFLYFITPYLYLNYRTVQRRLSLWIAVSILPLMVASGMTWYVYSDGLETPPDQTIEKLSGRLVGQGELWYIQVKLGAPVLAWDQTFADRNIESLTVLDVNRFAVENSLGPYYFSNRYSPEDIRRSMLRKGGTVSLTSVYEPLALAVFGWGGVAIAALGAGALFALMKLYLAYAIASRSIISAVLSIYVAQFFGTFLTQGTPYTAMSVTTLKWLGVVLVIELAMLVLGMTQSKPGLRQRQSFFEDDPDYEIAGRPS